MLSEIASNYDGWDQGDMIWLVLEDLWPIGQYKVLFTLILFHLDPFFTPENGAVFPPRFLLKLNIFKLLIRNFQLLTID